MPITPLHIGPGVLIKSVGGSSFSLSLFALSQVMMDLEVIIRLILGSHQLHGFSNTIIGATVLLLVSVPLGKPICEGILRWWNRNLSQAQSQWLQISTSISWTAAWTGGFLGVYSHFILDAIMHSDAIPWMPFSAENPFIGYLSIGQLNIVCLVCLLLGALIIGIYRFVKIQRSIMGSNRHS